MNQKKLPHFEAAFCVKMGQSFLTIYHTTNKSSRNGI